MSLAKGENGHHKYLKTQFENWVLNFTGGDLIQQEIVKTISFRDQTLFNGWDNSPVRAIVPSLNQTLINLGTFVRLYLAFQSQ